MSTGPNTVANRNHFDRTRSKYSRRITAISLSMTAHPLVDVRGANFLEEDPVQ
jgi:hypothetical protein